MPKKRRVTTDQARLLAIRYIQCALENELSLGEQPIPANVRRPEWYFKGTLPPLWFDNNTSDKSWDFLWEEMRVQLLAIMKGLDREALRIKILNPEFQYTTLYPIQPKIAP